MNIVKPTVVVVFTLLGLAILIPLSPFLVLMFGQSIVQGAEIGIGAVVLAFVFAVIKVSSENASRRATLARLKFGSEQRIRDARFTNEADFRAAGGLRHENWREIYAQSQGYKTWQEYTVLFIAQRKAGVSIDATAQAGTTSTRSTASDFERRSDAEGAGGGTESCHRCEDRRYQGSSIVVAWVKQS
jgi:hypothetical protein